MTIAKNPASSRIPFIDSLRGLAVCWMIIFHFTYDLRLFDWPSLPPSAQWYWLGFPRLIVATFLLSMGLALSAAHAHGISTKKYLKRWLKITAAALLVSLGTYLSFPDRWVYFGTLHCISVSSLLIWPLLGRPKLSLVLGLLILICDIGLGLRIPWIHLDMPSMDYIPPFPWVAWALVGVGVYPQISSRRIKLPPFCARVLEFLGLHSLKIYLLHQPLLVGAFWVVKLMI